MLTWARAFVSFFTKAMHSKKEKKAAEHIESTDEKIKRVHDALWDFDTKERLVSQGLVGFGNPDSRLSQLEQFHLWKAETIQKGDFPDRDDFCRRMAAY